MDKLKHFAHQLKTKRLSKGFTQQELADSTGISLRSIQRIESGEVYPRSFTLKALCEKLDLDFNALDTKNVATNSMSKIEPAREINRSQKTVLSSVIAIVFSLLVVAFIFQSATFPETAFEMILLLAFMIGIYGIVLFRIWR